MADLGSILTYSGKRFNVFDPRPEDVDPIDIAHSLSNQCRYTGHTKFHYSVATHCVLIYDYLKSLDYDQEVLTQAVIHDGGEAYLLDLAAPLKHHPDGFGERFMEVEEAIEKVICERFGIPHPFDPVVKQIDLQLRENEMSELFPRADWRRTWGEKLPIRKIPHWTPTESRTQLLHRFEECGLVWRGPRGVEMYRATERELVTV